MAQWRLRILEKASLSVAGKKEEKLDNLLPNLVDETLKYVFSETGAKVIYNYIENDCHLRLEEIVQKPEVFSNSLRKLLGSGALVIEKIILKNLYSKLGLKYEEKKGYEFSDYIRELRKSHVVNK